MEKQLNEQLIEKKDLLLNIDLFIQQDLSKNNKSRNYQDIESQVLEALIHGGDFLELFGKFEQCLLSENFDELKFDSLFFGLAGYLKNFVRNEIKDSDKLFLKAFKMIFLLSDYGGLTKLSEKLFEEIESRINETLSWVNIEDRHRNFGVLEIILAEIQRKNEVVGLIIKRRGAQVYFDRTIQYFCKHLSEFLNEQVNMCVKFMNFLIENIIGGIEKIEEAYLIILKSKVSENIIQEIFSSFEIGFISSKSLETFQKLMKVFLKLLLNKSICSNLALYYFNKLKPHQSSRTYTEAFKTELKLLLLKSKSLKNKQFLLEIINPWISNGVSKIEFKLILRQCNLTPELTHNFFNCILQTCKYAKESNSCFKVGGIKLIKFSLNFSVCRHKEFVVWMKFNPDSFPQHLMNIVINKSVFLYFYIVDDRISVIYKGKNKKQKKLVDFNLQIKEKYWNLIGFFFNFAVKNKKKFGLSVEVNKIRLEQLLDTEIKIKSIDLVEFTGTGSLEMLCMYSKFINYQELFELHPGALENIMNCEVFKLTPQAPLPRTKNIKETVNNAELLIAISLESIISSIQSINFFLPILFNSNTPSPFYLFFQILSVLSNSQKFSSLLNDETFPILGYILSKKPFLSTIETLSKIQEFLQSFTENPKFSEAYEHLILIPHFWIIIQECDLVCYLEILKTFSSYLRGPDIIKNLKKMIGFFEVILKLGNSESKPTIFYYYYNTFSIIIKNACDNDRAEVTREIFCFMMTDAEIDRVEFSIMAVEVQYCKWKLKNSEIVKEIFRVLKGACSRLGERLSGDILRLGLNMGKEHYITLEQEESNEFFSRELKGLFLLVDEIIKQNYQLNLSKILCEFLITKKLENSQLVNMAEIITKNLISNNESAEIVLALIETFCKKSQRFSLILSKQSDFPGWIINLLSKKKFEIQSLLNIIAIIFSNISSFSNFNNLRSVLNQLKKLGNFSAIFQILKEIYLIGFMLISFKSKNTKYLFEFYNVLEDILFYVPYNNIPVNDYLSLVKSILIHLECIPFCQKFLSIGGLNFLHFKNHEKETNEIEIREGGITRQVLIFVFYAMSFGQDSELENFLLSFLRPNKNYQEERREFKQVRLCECVEKVGFFVQNNKIVEDLMSLFIYTEWVEIIKVYYYRKIGHEEVLASIKNLTCFIQNSNIWKIIKKEIKTSLDYNGIKVLIKILKEKINFIHFGFIPEEFVDNYKNIEYIESTLEIINDETKSLEENIIVKNRKTIKIYAENLKAFTIMGKVEDFIKSTQNETKVTLFLKGLTTFKVISFAKYYMFLTDLSHEIKYFFNYFPTENFTPQKICRIKFVDNSDFIEKSLKNLKKMLGQFIGIINKQCQEKLFLRSNVDSQGKLNYTSPIKYKSNEAETELSPYSECSIESIKLTLDQTSFLNSSNEFSCEIIYIKGALFGALAFETDHLVFGTVPKSRPIISPSLDFENYGQVLFSSSLAETQLRKTVKKYFFYSDIIEIVRKKFIHNLCAIEIYLKSGKSYLINFFNRFTLEKVHSILKEFLMKTGTKFSDKTDLPKYQKKWLLGKITNFEYLLILNKYASRSFNSLSSYPIFPWVLNYLETETLDINDESIYRDLYYPISAQSHESRLNLQNTLKNSKSDLFGPYHFGSHYSTGALILNYLIRIEPYTTQNRILHEKSFDLPDRIFYSIHKLWSTTQILPSDPKELIPQFYYLPELFYNKNSEKFGCTQSGLIVNDVILPKWAKNNVYFFLYFQRKVLESEFVSKNLNHWIDMIFGYRQDGDKATEDYNLFHPVTYTEKYKEIIKNCNEELKKMVFSQAFYYGQIPEKLFEKPHSVKKSRSNLLFDGLFENSNLKFVKRKFSAEKFVGLNSSKYFIILILGQTVSCLLWEWSDIGELTPNCSKKFELLGVYPTETFISVVFKNLYIVSAGYQDNSVIFHHLSGQIHKIYNFHSNTISSLIGGKCIISSSLDSSIVCWTQSKILSLNGHIGPVLGLTHIPSYNLIGSFSDYFLIHDNRTGEVLRKLKENIFRIFSNCFGMFFIVCKNQLKVLYMNGDWVKVLGFHNKRLLSVYEYYLFIETFDGLEVWNLFEEDKKKVLVSEIEDIEGIACCKHTDSLVVITMNSCLIMYNSIRRYAIDFLIS